MPTMLVLDRYIGDSIIIGDAASEDAIAVCVVNAFKQSGVARVKIGVSAPLGVPVFRPKLVRRMLEERGVEPALRIRQYVMGRPNTEAIEDSVDAYAALHHEARQRGEYWYATRKSDCADCIVWRYEDAKGRQQVACCRTLNAKPDAFDFHRQVPRNVR